MGGWVGWVQKRSLHITSTYLLTASTSWSAWGGGGGAGWGGVQLRACAGHTDWTFTWYPLPLACSLHPCFGQHGGGGVGMGWGGVLTINGSSAHIESGSPAHIEIRSSAHIESGSSAHIERSSAHIDAGRVGMGWGGVGCNNVPCALFPLTCSLHPRLGQHGGWGGVGWGWGAITYLCSAHGLDVHPAAIHFHLLAYCTPCLGQHGGVGWGAITYLFTRYPLPLTCSLHPRLGQHGVGCNNVPCTSLPLTCSLHPRLGQHGVQ